MLQDAGLVLKLPALMLEHDKYSRQLSAADAALLELADPGLTSHITLIGSNTLELLCALLRRGCADVSTTRVSDMAPTGTTDVAFVPFVASPECLERTIAHARRALSPFGMIAIHVAAYPNTALSRQAGRLLLLHGFSAIHMIDFSGDTLIRAELLMDGESSCA